MSPSLSARRAWIEMPPVPMEITMPGVALRKESVDRNTGTKSHDPGQVLSLSARRAWIEINDLRAERSDAASLSARRAWIEISSTCWQRHSVIVALRKESVDRNWTSSTGCWKA